MTDLVYILFFVAFAIAIYKGGVAGGKRERRSKRYKRKYPTQRMYDNFTRTGNVNYLCDEHFRE